MNTFAQDTLDLTKAGEAALNFYKQTYAQWMNLMEEAWRDSGNGYGKSTARPAADTLTQWLTWQKDIMGGASAVKPYTGKLMSLCMKQNENCFTLGTNWFASTLKMMEAWRLNMQHPQNPEEGLKVCRESALDYWQSCMSFMDSQFFGPMQAWKAWQDTYNGNGKAEDAKSEAKSTKSAK